MNDTIKSFLQDDAARENDYQRDLHEIHSSRNPVFNWRKQPTTERLMTLTSPQKRVWVYIASYIHKFHCPPTVREIGKHCGYIGVGGAVQALDRLQEKGIIARKERGKARAYTLFVWPPVDQFVTIQGEVINE